MAEQPPDIEFRAHVRAERVEVKQDGEAKIELRVEPNEDEAKRVRVERSAPAGQRSYRNLTIDLHAEVLIADPAAKANANVTTIDKQAGEPE